MQFISAVLLKNFIYIVLFYANKFIIANSNLYNDYYLNNIYIIENKYISQSQTCKLRIYNSIAYNNIFFC